MSLGGVATSGISRSSESFCVVVGVSSGGQHANTSTRTPSSTKAARGARRTGLRLWHGGRVLHFVIPLGVAAYEEGVVFNGTSWSGTEIEAGSEAIADLTSGCCASPSFCASGLRGRRSTYNGWTWSRSSPRKCSPDRYLPLPVRRTLCRSRSGKGNAFTHSGGAPGPEEHHEAPSGGGGEPPTSSQSPPPSPSTLEQALKCRKGFKKMTVHGKSKCVKLRHRHKKHQIVATLNEPGQGA